MSDYASLPQGARPFVAFASLLRANGFAVAPDQTQNFLAGVELLGPRSMRDIRAAAYATLAPQPERRDEFDALFDHFFLGRIIAAPAPADAEEEELQAYDDRDGRATLPEPDEETESGAEATRTERLGTRLPAISEETLALQKLRRRAPRDLPMRRARRRFPVPRGGQPDIRRALRAAVRLDGELVRLPTRKRRRVQRRIVLLIDISGSMKTQTDRYLLFAHALCRTVRQCEVFTLGTRLTRISRAIRLRDQNQAMHAAGGLVADWDGGTRLGDALSAFLDVPRFASFSRGALVVILSDGLERGSPDALVGAVARLQRLAWGILWLTPLVGDAEFRPQTEAMQRIADFVDRFGDGRDVAGLTSEVLAFAKRAA